MEADWAIEVGPALASLTVPWECFVDLRCNPAAIKALSEAAAHPALREALLNLNAERSFVFTSKCDVWKLSDPEIDSDEFDSLAAESHAGVASYVDILHRDPDRFASFEFHEKWVRTLVGHLRGTGHSNARVDLVVRSASIESFAGYGLTMYTAGCGAEALAAYASWEAVLRLAVDATINLALIPPSRASSSIG